MSRDTPVHDVLRHHIAAKNAPRVGVCTRCGGWRAVSGRIHPHAGCKPPYEVQTWAVTGRFHPRTGCKPPQQVQTRSPAPTPTGLLDPLTKSASISTAANTGADMDGRPRIPQARIPQARIPPAPHPAGPLSRRPRRHPPTSVRQFDDPVVLRGPGRFHAQLRRSVLCPGRVAQCRATQHDGIRGARCQDILCLVSVQDQADC
jgi:hypothetical protein